MNFEGNFRQLGNYDVSALKQRILDLPDDQWIEHSLRQNAFVAHRFTNTIPLLYNKDFRYVNPTRHRMYEAFEEEVGAIIEQTKNYFDQQGYPLRIILARLRPTGVIKPHCDGGDSLLFAHRIHIPVITNDKVFFSVGSERRNLDEGEVWEINNARRHSVENTSYKHRVHLILDWVTPDVAELRRQLWSSWSDEAREVLALLRKEVKMNRISNPELSRKTQSFWEKVDGVNMSHLKELEQQTD